MFTSTRCHQKRKVFKNALWQNVHKEKAQVLFDRMNNYTDHLGNVRLSYTQDPQTGALAILEENHYYPFGLQHKNYNSDITKIDLLPQQNNEKGLKETAPPSVPLQNPRYMYKFQGQERQDEFGLGWDSFKWRNYNPEIGRFMTIDPLAEIYRNWGGYVFSGNRVIDSRELEGLEPHSIHANQDAAARNFSQHYNGISILENREYVARIYSVTDVNGVTTYSYGVPAPGSGAGATPSQSAIPTGTTYTAFVHTHAAYDARYANDVFSGTVGSSTGGGDIGYAETHSVDGYVVTPNGSFQRYDFTNDIIIPLSTDMVSDPNHPSRLNTRAPIVPLTPITPAPITPVPAPLPTVTPLPPLPAPVVPNPTPAPLPIIIPPRCIDC